MVTTLTSPTTMSCYLNIINGSQCSKYNYFLIKNLLPTTQKTAFVVR